MNSLQSVITGALKPSAWDSKDFMPINKFDQLITKEQIESAYNVQLGTAFSDSRKVIAILIWIDKLDALEALRCEGLTDEHLPVTFDHGQKSLVSGERKFRSLSGREKDFYQFSTAQWLFMSPVLGQTGLEPVHQFCPLPIIYKGESRGVGSYGVVHDIKVHHAHLTAGPPQVSFMLSLFGMPHHKLKSFRPRETSV
jgi:hypothetical protein